MALAIDHAAFKGYFNAGDKPSEAQFAALIDALALVDASTGTVVYKDGISYVTGQIVGLHSQNIAAADMLTAGVTEIAVTIPRESGQTITPIFPIVGSLVFNSVAFATNTVIGIRYVGADEPIATCDLLARTASGTVNFVPVTTVGAGDTQYLGDTDLEIYVIGGNPISGNSFTAVSFGYIKQS